jgi:hypothetical protein
MKSLPHRFREDQFRRYELAIAAAITRFPNVTRFTPNEVGLSTTTFACRFRDACRSFYEHAWISTAIDLALFNQVYLDLTVSERGDEVWVGDAAMIKHPPVTYDFAKTYLTDPIPITASKFTPISLLAFLAHSRALQPILITDLPDDLAMQLQADYDITLTLTPKGYVLT